MARARLVVADTSSEEIDHMRRTLNTVLLMLESAEASITAGASAADILNAWADGVRTGRDNNPAAISNVVSTGREVLGLKPTPLHPRRRSVADTVVMISSDTDF